MAPRRTKAPLAFTAAELVVVIAALAILAVVFLPVLAKHTARASRVSCVSNLKQVGMTFRMWAEDHGRDFPMRVSITNGGTRELVSSGVVFPHFQVMSNELNTPKILLCPWEKLRRPATNFARGLADANLSYFVNVDAIPGEGSNVLVADRNITNRPSVGSPLVDIAEGTTIAWNEEVHGRAGNLGFADGSVEQRVRKVVVLPAGVTNRLAVPEDPGRRAWGPEDVRAR